MRDYVKEFMDAWTSDGEQAAFDFGAELLTDIMDKQLRLRRQVDAIGVLRAQLANYPNVETGPELAEPPEGLDAIEPSERPRLIMEAAIEVWQNQMDYPSHDSHLVKVQDVLHRLNNKSLDLGVQQPLAVIGTVLARADGFKKIARNTFEYSRPVQNLDDFDLAT